MGLTSSCGSEQTGRDGRTPVYTEPDSLSTSQTSQNVCLATRCRWLFLRFHQLLSLAYVVAFTISIDECFTVSGSRPFLSWNQRVSMEHNAELSVPGRRTAYPQETHTLNRSSINLLK